MEDCEDDVFILKHALRQVHHEGEFVHLSSVSEAKEFLRKIRLRKRTAWNHVCESPNWTREWERLGSAHSFGRAALGHSPGALPGLYLYGRIGKSIRFGTNPFLLSRAIPWTDRTCISSKRLLRTKPRRHARYQKRHGVCRHPLARKPKSRLVAPKTLQRRFVKCPQGHLVRVLTKPDRLLKPFWCSLLLVWRQNAGQGKTEFWVIFADFEIA